MARRTVTMGFLAVFMALAASSADSPLQLTGPRPNLAPGTARLFVVGSRSAQQRRSAASGKMDSVLADLVRHAPLARPEHVLADLHALSPAARFVQRGASATPLVLIDAVTRGDPQRSKSALVALGLERAAQYSNDVGGWLPVDATRGCGRSRRGHLHARGHVARRRGAGDLRAISPSAAMSFAANNPCLTGAGVTVGVLSDSFDCYAIYGAPGSGVPVSGNAGYAYNGFTADYADGSVDRCSARRRDSCVSRSRLLELRRPDATAVRR